MGAQFSYLKQHRSMQAVSPLHPRTPNCESKPVQVFTEKKSSYKWTRMVQTQVVQGQLDNKTLIGSNVLVCV